MGNLEHAKSIISTAWAKMVTLEFVEFLFLSLAFSHGKGGFTMYFCKAERAGDRVPVAISRGRLGAAHDLQEPV